MNQAEARRQTRQARVSQRGRRGATPTDLAAARRVVSDERGAEGLNNASPLRDTAAARAEAEVAALLKQCSDRDAKAKELEAQLVQTRAELADYKLILGLVFGVALFQAATGLAVATVSSGGWWAASAIEF